MSTGLRPRTPTVAAGIVGGGVGSFENVESEASLVDREEGMIFCGQCDSRVGQAKS